jgi:hypothetical protein
MISLVGVVTYLWEDTYLMLECPLLGCLIPEQLAPGSLMLGVLVVW